MKLKLTLIYSILLLIVFPACEKNLLKEEFNNDAVGNFNALWTEFDLYYGAFEAKHINWDSLKVVYGKNISTTTKDGDLYKALTGLIGTLNDGHAFIYAPGLGSFNSHKLRSFFSDADTRENSKIIVLQEVIQKDYLNDDYRKTGSSPFTFFYGSINSGTHKIGYLCIPTFVSEDYPEQFVEDAVSYFKNMDAIIIDIRFNSGGSAEAFVKAIDLFSSERKLYIKSKDRNGPQHNDFTSFEDHYTEPKNSYFKTKPIVVLVNGQTASSSEHFLLGMKSQSNVISVGDTTWGAFSVVVDRIMPNGWQYRLGAQVVYTPEGKLLTDSKGNYLEGIGIAPDYCVKDKLQSIENGHDNPLDFALTKLNLIIK